MRPIIVLLFASVIFYGCPLINPYCDDAEYFTVPAHVIPLQSAYKIGDTLKIVSKFSKYVEGFRYADGIKSVGEFDMTGISWSPFVHLYRIDANDTLNRLPNINTKFATFIPDTNYRVSVSTAPDYGEIIGVYNFQKDSFLLEISLKLIEEGTFVLEIASSANDLRRPQSYIGQCSSFDPFNITFRFNGNKKNNYEFMTESPDSLFNTRFYRQSKEDESRNFSGYYCFKVTK